MSRKWGFAGGGCHQMPQPNISTKYFHTFPNISAATKYNNQVFQIIFPNIFATTQMIQGDFFTSIFSTKKKTTHHGSCYRKSLKDCLLDGFFLVLVLYDIIDNLPTKYFIKFVSATFCSAWEGPLDIRCLHLQTRALTIVLRTNGKSKVWYFSLFELNLKSSDVKVFERAGQHSGPHTKFLLSLTSLPLIWNFLHSLSLKCISISYILKSLLP